MEGTRCSCGGGCLTFGECIRRKGLRIGYCRSSGGYAGDRSAQKAHDKEIELYRSAKAQGIQPAGTSTAASRYAIEQSNKMGQAFNAETVGGVL